MELRCFLGPLTMPRVRQVVSGFQPLSHRKDSVIAPKSPDLRAAGRPWRVPEGLSTSGYRRLACLPCLDSAGPVAGNGPGLCAGLEALGTMAVHLVMGRLGRARCSCYCPRSRLGLLLGCCLSDWSPCVALMGCSAKFPGWDLPRSLSCASKEKKL